MDLIYVAGPPGVGKTTVMAELTGGCDRLQADKPMAHVRLVDPTSGAQLAVELGRDRPTFAGTDALPMAVSPVACMWMRRGGPGGLVLAEGDRLAHMGFLEAAAAGGYTVTLIHLQAPGDVLDRRCAARGSTQDDSWRRGRATKAARLAATASAAGLTVVPVDGCPPAAALVAALRACLPALAGLPDRAAVTQ